MRSKDTFVCGSVRNVMYSVFFIKSPVYMVSLFGEADQIYLVYLVYLLGFRVGEGADQVGRSVS